MKQIEGFKTLGLSGRDSRVYLALLREGVSSIRNISDTTGINRGSVYESIKDLMAVGLVSYQQNRVNKKYFAEEPSKIVELIDRRREELDAFELKTKALIPSLIEESAYMPYANIKFFEDHEGVAVILRDVLATVSKLDNKEYLAISSKPMRAYLYKRFPSFTKQRVAAEVFVRVIAVGRGGDEAEIAERKWLDADAENQPSNYILIYGNKFAMIALNDEMNPYGIVIEDAGVANMQRLAFNQLWQNL